MLELKNPNETNSIIYNFGILEFTNQLSDIEEISTKIIGDSIYFEWTEAKIDRTEEENYLFYCDNQYISSSNKNNITFTPNEKNKEYKYKVLMLDNKNIITRATSGSVKNIKMEDVNSEISGEYIKLEKPLNVRIKKIHDKYSSISLSWNPPKKN